MSADVSIELACRPRSVLGSSGLLAAVKAQGQAGLIEQLARRDGVAPEQLRVDLERGDEPLDYRALQAAAAPPGRRSAGSATSRSRPSRSSRSSSSPTTASR